MKTTLSLLLVATMLFSFKQTENKKNLATADQVEGIYIFMHSKPVAETNFLGTVKVNFTISGDQREIITKMLKKARKEYPSAQGIVIHDDFDKADVISFK